MVVEVIRCRDRDYHFHGYGIHRGLLHIELRNPDEHKSKAVIDIKSDEFLEYTSRVDEICKQHGCKLFWDESVSDKDWSISLMWVFEL